MLKYDLIMKREGAALPTATLNASLQIMKFLSDWEAYALGSQKLRFGTKADFVLRFDKQEHPL